CASVAGRSSFDGAELIVRVAEIVVDPGNTGLKRERVAIAFDGLVQLALRLKDQPKIVVRGGKLGTERERRAVTRRCVGQAAPCVKRVRQVVLSVDMGG